MNIGVFCASSNDINEVYYRHACELGQEIAAHTWKLVYGGTNCGLMQAVAEATVGNGGIAIGIIPECIKERGVAAQNATELLVAEDMKERKRMLREHSDAFIAMPGGWGTMEEITEVITLKQLGCHNKPIVFVNTDGFYDLFFKFIDDIRERGFVSKAYDNLFIVASDISEAIQYIETYKARDIVSKYNKN